MLTEQEKDRVGFAAFWDASVAKGMKVSEINGDWNQMHRSAKDRWLDRGLSRMFQDELKDLPELVNV